MGDVLEKYPCRNVRHSLVDGVLTAFPAGSPTVVTFDAWATLVFLAADGTRTVRQLIED